MSAFDTIRQSWRESTAPLRQRWLMLAPREQSALRILAIFAVVLIAVYGLWLPSRHAAENYRLQYEKNRELLVLMQNSSNQIRSSAASTNGGSVLGIVSGAAAAGGLNLSRIEPEGDSQVRVWLEKADFNRIAAWLTALAAQGVTLKEVQAEKQADNNGVSARLMLSR